MKETPREYKKRVDEKWINNEKNRDKLIKKIDEYELLDKDYKTVTKQQILDNFSKNQKADKENDKYLTIVSELGSADKKYKELEELKEKLNQKIGERDGVKQKFGESELDGADETTLNMQMANMHALMEQFDNLGKDIAEIEKEISNREQEIQEIESTYGVKKDEILSEDLSQTETESAPVEMIAEDQSTLKSHHEQTIKDLWNKDRARKEIIELLDDGTGIDDELKESIKKEVSDRFFEYYDKRQGDVKTQAARFIKNKVKSQTTFRELRSIPEEADKEKKLKEIEELEQIYGVQAGRTRLLLKLDKEGFHVEQLEIEECGIISGNPVFKVKDLDGTYSVYWGTERYGDRYKEIGEIQNIGNKPCFKVRYDDRDYGVYWGREECGDRYKEIGEIQNIGNEPCFKVRYDDGDYGVYWGTERYGGRYKEIGEIQNIGNKLCFKVRYGDGDYSVYWGGEKCGDRYKEIGEIQNIGDKPCFKVGSGRYCSVYWGRVRLVDRYKEIGEIQNIGNKPCFKAKNSDGDYGVYWGGEKCGKRYAEIGEIINVGGKPVFEVKREKGGRWIRKRW